jgi:hypothetical protein
LVVDPKKVTTILD